MVKFYIPRRYNNDHGLSSPDHGLSSPARAPCPPFYYYKKARCMRRMYRRLKLQFPKAMCFHMVSNGGNCAAKSNLLRMYPNVPECTSNVPPNVPTGSAPSRNPIFRSVSRSGPVLQSDPRFASRKLWRKAFLQSYKAADWSGAHASCICAGHRMTGAQLTITSW